MPATRAIRSLLAKDVDQHRQALAGVSLLLLLAWLLSGFTFSQESRTLSELERLTHFLRQPLLVAVVFLGHRLVVAELYARSHRFLEGLPLPRWQALVVKAGLGYAIVVAWALVALGWALLAAGQREPLGRHFTVILLARVLVYCFCVWGVAFLFGCFGRLRVALAVLVLVTLRLVDGWSTVDLDRFGPLALTDPRRLPFERTVMPLGDLLEAWLLGAGAFAVAFAIQRVREGSVAESLARRMSPREWSALVVMVMVAIVTLVVVEARKPIEPYQPTTTNVWEAPGGLVRVTYVEPELLLSAQRLGGELAATLDALNASLSLQPPTRVDLVHAPDVRAGRVRTAFGDAAGGVVMRVNLSELGRAPGSVDRAAADPEVIAQVLHAILSMRTRGRAGREPQHWFLDGFSMHFAVHGRAPAAPVPSSDPASLDPWLLAGLKVAPRVFDETNLRRYHPLLERLGDPGLLAFAATGVRVLEAKAGRARLIQLARETLGRPHRGHLRDFVHAVRHPFSEELARAAGMSSSAFARHWSEQLALWRQLPVAARLLDGQPRGQGWVVLDEPSAPNHLGLRLRWMPPGPRSPLCTVRHQRLPWRAVNVDEDVHEEQTFTVAPATRPGETLDRPFPGGYGSGERAFVAVDCDLPGLPLPERLIGERVMVP